MITTLKFETKQRTNFIDITENVQRLVSDVKEGFVIVATQHTTMGLWVNEAEDGLIRDMKKKIEEMFPTNLYYEHDDFSKRKCPSTERRNAFSHMSTTLFNSSIVIPVKDGKMVLGTYQRILFVELDGPREERKLIVQVCNAGR